MIRNGINVNAIYQHYKGDYYKVIEIASDADDEYPPVVIYYKCDENGIFKSLRNNDNELIPIVHQPFYRFIGNFKGVVPGPDGEQFRFKFIRQL